MTPKTQAQEKQWRDLLYNLDSCVLVYGEELPEEAWDDLQASLDALAPGADRDTRSVRALAERALRRLHGADEGPSAVPVSEDGGPGAQSTTEGVSPGRSTASVVADDVYSDPTAVAAFQRELEVLSGLEERTTRARRGKDRRAGTLPYRREAPSSSSLVSREVPVAASRPGTEPRWPEIAVAVLEASGREMTASELLAWSQERGPRRSVSGKTPTQTINRDLHEAIRRGHPRLRHGSVRGRFAVVDG